MGRKKMIVAYSGGLDTSVMVKWLSEKYDDEIIAVTGDLGQKGELKDIEEKALKTGASKSYIVDIKEEFLTHYVWKALKSSALYEGSYPLACSIGRPLLAKLMVDIAIKEGADTIVHGCTGKGNDQVRFEVGINSLAPELKVIAPLREWEMKSREDEIEYALKHNIPLSISKDSPYSIDENIWGTAVECGVLEDPKESPPEDAFQNTTNPQNAPETPGKISIGFEKGIPISLNGDKFPPVELVTYLNDLGGKHGIGRLDLIENRVVGIKSREIYEAPAAVILHNAHTELENLIMDRETFRAKQDISNKIANLIYDGLWFTPLFNCLTAFVDESQQNISGEIKMEFYKGNITVISRDSKFSLYNQKLATYSSSDTFDHSAAEGFIKLFGLPYKLISEVEKENLHIEVV